MSDATAASATSNRWNDFLRLSHLYATQHTPFEVSGRLTRLARQTHSPMAAHHRPGIRQGADVAPHGFRRYAQFRRNGRHRQHPAPVQQPQDLGMPF